MTKHHKYMALLFLTAMLASNLASAQCASEAQARIDAEQRHMELNPAFSAAEAAVGTRKFSEDVNRALPRELASAKQDGAWNRNNPQFKLTVQKRISEHKDGIGKARANQRSSKYREDVAAIEREISGRLYNICLLEESLKSYAAAVQSTSEVAGRVSANASNTGNSEASEAATQQQAQQQSQKAQQLAQKSQARADKAREGKRKTNDPAAQAHQCIAIDESSSGNFGAFKNTCGYKVNFEACNYKPRVRQGGFNWSADFDCEKQQFGLHTPDGGASVAAHNRNTELVYWFACKAPATPVDVAFVAGKGVEGRCHN